MTKSMPAAIVEVDVVDTLSADEGVVITVDKNGSTITVRLNRNMDPDVIAEALSVGLTEALAHSEEMRHA